LVYYQGSVLNVKSLEENLGKNETARLKSEEKCLEVRRELGKSKILRKSSPAFYKIKFENY